MPWLQLHALAYNLANFLRTIATPEAIQSWSLTSLRERLIKTGTRLVRHACHLPDGGGRFAQVCVQRHSGSDQRPARATSCKGWCMMAGTQTIPGREAEAGDSKAQHALILVFCSKISGITRSARTDGALNSLLSGRTGLKDEVIDDNPTRIVSNGECRINGCRDGFCRY